MPTNHWTVPISIIKWREIFRIFGTLLIFFSMTMIIPIIIGLLSEVEGEDEAVGIFTKTGLILFSVGTTLRFIFRKYTSALKVRDGFIITTFIWIVLGFAASLPFHFHRSVGSSWVDSFFEAISALTTTGASIFNSVETLPPSLAFYRVFLQFVGGLGIVILAIAILPSLGLGGMNLYNSEAVGPFKNEKLTPKIKDTAKLIFYVYIGLTIVCATAYFIAGMPMMEAIGHSFSTIATGGLAMHDNSIAFYNSATIEWIAVIFMLLGAMNFCWILFAWKRRSIMVYWQNAELRFFLFSILTIAIIAFAFSLQYKPEDVKYSDYIRNIIFFTVSTTTTTGLTTTSPNIWPMPTALLILMLSCLGGCAGSTSSGMKSIRVLLLLKQIYLESKHILHPHGHFGVHIKGVSLSSGVTHSIWSYFAIYSISFLVMTLLMVFTGSDLWSAWASVAACINNMGVGAGDTASNFSSLSNAQKIILSVTMLIGRLEFFAILVMFTPAFWQR